MTRYCPFCGEEISDTATFCPKCGKKLKTPAGTPAPGFAVNQPQAVAGAPVQAGSPKCLWCGQSAGFKLEEGKMDSKWGFTAHKFKMYICNNCGYTHLFGLGRTIFDFD